MMTNVVVNSHPNPEKVAAKANTLYYCACYLISSKKSVICYSLSDMINCFFFLQDFSNDDWYVSVE